MRVEEKEKLTLGSERAELMARSRQIAPRAHLRQREQDGVRNLEPQGGLEGLLFDGRT
jgi:hypothetical protein